MSHRPFRFVHASDFYLDRPVHGLTEVPDHLRDLLIECPYRAAARVFDAAVAEGAEFMVLSGNLLDSTRAGARSVLFLVEQFARLEERGIPVYWAGGPHDVPDDWPAPMLLPGNVHLFPTRRPEEVFHETADGPVARLVGWSRSSRRKLRPKEFSGSAEGFYTIAVANGSAPRDQLAERDVDYWALGGTWSRSNLQGRPRVAHAPGSPQARDPDHTGPHGCTLVQVDADRRPRLSSLVCDAVRWHRQRVDIEPSTTRALLEQRLDALCHQLREEAGPVELLVEWRIGGQGALLGQLRRGRLATELLTRLRGNHGHQTPALWSVSLEVERAAGLPATWYEEDTLRGDFLRAARSRQAQATAEKSPLEINLADYLGTLPRADELVEAARLSGDALVDALREAAVLGAGLLGGGEEQP